MLRIDPIIEWFMLQISEGLNSFNHSITQLSQCDAI